MEEVGYRKRLQYGISELRSAHPEWAEHSGKAVSELTLHVGHTHTHSHASTQSQASSTQDKNSSAAPSPAHSTLPPHNPTNFEVRPPSIAQTVPVGGGHHMAKLPSTTWRHPNEVLVNSSVTYHTRVRAPSIIGCPRLFKFVVCVCVCCSTLAV